MVAGRRAVRGQFFEGVREFEFGISVYMYIVYLLVE